MATSGSKNFSVTRSELIQAAMRKCGVLDSAEPIDPGEEADAAFALNALVKEWVAQGIDIFLRDEITLFLNSGQSDYYLGGEDNAPLISGYPTMAGEAAAVGRVYETVLDTEIAPAGASMNFTLRRPAATNNAGPVEIAIGTHFALELDNGVTYYGNVGTFSNPSITIDVTTYEYVSVYTGVGITQVMSTASAGNKLYLYNASAPKPSRILYAARADNNGQEVPVNLSGENNYERLSRKEQTGPTTQVWYKPGLTNGLLSVWPLSGITDTYNRLIMQATFRPDDMDAVSDNPEFPIEWANALIFNLAHDLAPEYGVDRTSRADLYAIGQRKLKEVLDWDQENASVIFSLDQRYHA